MKELVTGAMVMMYLVAGLFFLRFWKKSRDPLFILFGIAFGILAGQRLALVLTSDQTENATWCYGARLIAFVVILVAIWNKNRKGTA